MTERKSRNLVIESTDDHCFQNMSLVKNYQWRNVHSCLSEVLQLRSPYPVVSSVYRIAKVKNEQVSFTRLCAGRSFVTTAHLQSDSKQNNKGRADSEGFEVESLDSESKEKLQKLKNMILNNSYFNKYKAKIVELQRTHPREFLALLEGLKSSKPKSPAADFVPKMNSPTKKRNLEDVMKVDLLRELGKEDVSYIWQEYHRKNNLVAACIPRSVYSRICTRAQICSTFVLPLARSSGHDFHVLQYANDTFYFTPLVAWQAYKENSPVSLTLTNYDELRADKDVILLRGEFDKNIYNLREAQCLTVQTHLYFAEPTIKRNHLMELFVSSPTEFQYKDLIEELERMEKENQDLFPDVSSSSNST